MTYYRPISLFGNRGERKYLNEQERSAFYEYTKTLVLERRLFCMLLYYTGARIGEIAELRVQQLDFAYRLVIIRTLKRRRNDVYRQIPLPDHLTGSLMSMVDTKRQKGEIVFNEEPLWSFGPRTASRMIKHAMKVIGVDGIRASALGLRHSFAIHAVTKVPLTQVQKWMGHSSMTTTAIYLEVSGVEERQWAEMLW